VHAITLESKYGVPTVAIHTDIFRRLVDSVVRAKGMPRARYAFVPQPVMGKTPEQIVEYIIGNDPITGKPVLQEIVDGLTQRQELTEEDLKGLAFDRSTPRLLDADTEDNLHRLFQEKRWTDYLPIVLPTEERVAEMLCGTSHKATEVVGHMRPTDPNTCLCCSLSRPASRARAVARPAPCQAWPWLTDQCATS
jgi:hypothetical protein